MKITDLQSEKRVQECTQRINVSNDEFILYDFCKTHLTEDDRKNYKEKLLESGLHEKIEMMWRGDSVNYTENRSVLHYVLRDKEVLENIGGFVAKNGGHHNHQPVAYTSIPDIKKEVYEELVKIYQFSSEFRSLTGITGKEMNCIVNIGIGGSDLGPRMATAALSYYSLQRKVYFISNVDCTDTINVMSAVDPERTLFIVVSKTFTTAETMKNYELCLKLLAAKLNGGGTGKERAAAVYKERDIIKKHFVAVSANLEEVGRRGFDTTRVFKMWDFVGGRYSLWSAVGLSIALYVGFENYLRLLRGASAADANFYEAKENSVSAELAAIELYYIDRGYNNTCIVAYDSYLSLLYRYLQQAEMESNGKKGSGQMIVWGGVGTDAQHSYFQLIHQGEQKILCQFLIGIENLSATGRERNRAVGTSEEREGDAAGSSKFIPEDETHKRGKFVSEDGTHENEISECLGMYQEHQDILFSNFVAQGHSLMVGRKSAEEGKYFPGDKPSIGIVYSRLSPETLGGILAVYEHKIFTEGVYFRINSFDQFGVQLGKDIAKDVEALIKEGTDGLGGANNGMAHDNSMRYLISEYKNHKIGRK